MAAELAATTSGPEGHLLLEQPLLRVPFELARRNHKSAQRNVEREREQLLATLKATASQCRASEISSQSTLPQNGHAPPNPAIESLDGMIRRMETLKRKLESLHAEEQVIHKSARARIDHLQELHEIPSSADVKFDRWSKVRLNRLLVDYLLRLGYDSSALAFARETGIEKLVDIDAFVQCSKVERSLQEGRTQEALAWCAENKAYLKKSNACRHRFLRTDMVSLTVVQSSLEFELRLQQYIELVRTRQTTKLLEATVHAKKYLTSHTDSQRAVHAAGLLAFPPDTQVEEYQQLYSRSRWSYLSDLFLRTHHSLLSLPALPALHVALSAGLSSLKTPSCHSIHAASSGNVSTSTSGTSVCPICSTELNELARTVPYANHAKSSIEADPVVLPNGRIYGRERLLRLNEKMIGPGGAWEGEGTIRDPMNPAEEFAWEEIKKVYIM